MGAGARGNGEGGNYFPKFHSRNPLARCLVHGFLASIKKITAPCQPQSILEVGCGEGIVTGELQRLFPEARVWGLDLYPSAVTRARRENPFCSFVAGSAYELPFADRQVDLVALCEVLEHLQRPDDALAEARRVCARDCLVTVPWEPVWRMLNLARGSYLSRLGNTPGHVQHWSRTEITALVGRHFRVDEVQRPLPWTAIRAHRL